MAHFAQLDENNTVLRVLAVNNSVIDNLPFPESEPLGVAFLQKLMGPNTVFKQTSYNNNFRARYSGVGFTYDVILDAFLRPRPYLDWVLDAKTADWIPPIPYPADGCAYVWQQSTHSWIKASFNTGLPDYEIV